MRIIGGDYKGRIFSPGKTFKARPTTDLAKESLFNILNNRIDFEETKVLDLFAGTGSISFEFLSRGSTDVTMVELNFKHIQFIKSVLSKLKLRAKVIRSDVLRYIASENKKYDLIFVDPPYDHPQFKDIVAKIIENELLEDNGIMIIEHPKEYDFKEMPGYSDTRKYGKVHFSFFNA
ncbi:MAG: 16S rRNA (guanine(966)-N(2))-methyltransferase RsmD [Prolixibacteraceae bacterium]|jgi:16S rRNA (guanine966-N2)-methyltransferase|nr:16S rRNA (guanine(966)-N(2))-methyltransferase RsmD [Prolixibacteraceae bacterium]